VSAALVSGCVMLGVVAPRILGLMYRVVQSISRAPLPQPPEPAVLSLVAPDGVSQTSPIVVAAMLVSLAILVFVLLRIGRFRLRRADTWGCGRIRQTPRMEYTSAAFAEPLRRIFSEL